MANIKFQNALARKAQNCPPIWFMRQAGRYHSHYQALRKDHSFVELCKNPKLAAEVALGPITEFDFDVSILFSDLLFPLEAMGMGLTYTDSQGPQLGWHLNPGNLHNLRSPDVAISDLEFQREAVNETRKQLPRDKSLIGFIGSPWTLFTYAVQGKHAGSLQEVKQSLNLFHPFCETLVPLLRKNIQLQLDAGAELVMIFDTAAGELSPWLYQSSVLPWLVRLVAGFEGKVGFYSKHTQASYFQDAFWKSQAFAGRGIDHRFNLAEVLQTEKTGFIQGNFDEALLFCTPQELEVRLDQYLAPLKNLSAEQRLGWVAGLGHGVLPKTPEANVKRMVKKIREEFPS